jgi:hypothetical protein
VNAHEHESSSDRLYPVDAISYEEWVRQFRPESARIEFLTAVVP